MHLSLCLCYRFLNLRVFRTHPGRLDVKCCRNCYSHSPLYSFCNSEYLVFALQRQGRTQSKEFISRTPILLHYGVRNWQ
jgi:hypothetical protein